MKKLFGFNLDEELKIKLGMAAKIKYTTQSGLFTQILLEWFDKFEGRQNDLKAVAERPKMTEEERLEDWEWRKKQVAEDKLPPELAEEYPVSKL